MKFLVVLALIALANGAPSHVSHHNYLTNMPRMPILPNAPKPQLHSSRIVGGTEATPHSWPWQVYLLFSEGGVGQYFCGGSLISENTVLTAGHCTVNAVTMTVHLGAHTQNDVHEEIEAAKIVPHENYTAITITNDIGLAILSTPAPINDNIKVGTLPKSSDEFVDGGELVTATGWGKTSDNVGAGVSNVLNQVSVLTITNDECIETYGALTLTANKLCTSGADGMGTCNGDSGGPLHTQDNTIVGLTSFGSSEGCTKGYPDAFTRTAPFLDWIAAHSG